MKLEVGKTYKLNNGDIAKCNKMFGDDPFNIISSGYGPFQINGMCYKIDGTFGSGKVPYFDVASCVDDDTPDTPPLWRDMTDAEKGALLLAHHEGESLQMLIGDEWFDHNNIFANNMAYRIKTEPKVKPVSVFFSGGTQFTWLHEGHSTHRITFNTIDGKPDTASIKMEVL